MMSLFPEGTQPVIAGPCSAESRDQVLNTAAGLQSLGVGIFRAGLWKPRTHPGCFEGVGAAGLEWLLEARRATGMKICTEVASPAHVRACLDAGVDMVWIGARTTSNPFQVQEIAGALRGSGIPVLVKNPSGQDIGLWSGAVERLQSCGVEDIALVLRGFASMTEKKYRNAPMWQVVSEMRMRFPGMPVLCDPSHMAGSRAYVAELSRSAMDIGLDGLMVEVHCCPAEALSDSAQQLTPGEFGRMMRSLSVRSRDCDDESYRSSMAELRARIDEIDSDILSSLASRMEVSRRIGECKRAHNISILQSSRWETVLARCCEDASGLGLDPAFVSRIFNAIHDASVAEQNKILSSDD